MAIIQREPEAVTKLDNTDFNAKDLNANINNNTRSTNHDSIYGNSITFGSNNFGIMSASMGSEYTIGVANAINDQYKNRNNANKPKVTILDKEFNSGLAYSCIVVSMLDNDIVSYFTCLLEATGRKTLTAEEVINEYEASIKNPNLRTIIYTADDAFDSVLHQMIVSVLKQEYPNIKKFKPVDGLVLNAQADIATISPMVAAIAHNACYLENELDSGKKTDLNIQHAVEKEKAANKQFKLESFMSKAINVNELGDPVRTDWKIDLNLVGLNNNVTSLNMDIAKKTLLRTGGYVDAIPELVTLPGMPGQPGIVQTRLRPQIIITANSPECPTLGYGLLGVVATLVMTNKSMWLSALKPNDPKDNVGALNVLTNINNNKDGGEKLPLGDKKYSLDVVYSIISNMFSLDPVFSYDITAFGPQTFYLSALSTAAQTDNSEEKLAAARQIVETASWLTGGNFPSNFPINEIFASDGVIIPVGKWSSKTGVRDIREIDLAFLAAHTDNIEFLEKWALSNLPKHVTGIDPYLTKVNIISKIVPTAEITGKAVRVTFTANFIKTLEAAAVNSGLNVRYAPQIEFAESNNLGIIANYLNHAGINGASGFAQAVTTNVGPNYNTPYSNVGFNRYGGGYR